MRDFLHLDFESASTQELRREKSVGLHNYWTHIDTRPLMLAYAYGNEDVSLWQPQLEQMPQDLLLKLQDSKILLSAWNSSFERYALKYKLGIDTAIDRWHDPQASARYLSLPGDLETVGQVLGLPEKFAKDKRGQALIELFSKPHKQKKVKRTNPDVYVFYDDKTHPAEWLEFEEYCRQDVRAEREIMRRETLLHAFPLPELERKIWIADQVINDRGIPTDIDFVKKANALGIRAKAEAVQKQNEMTGLENANSNTQLLGWVRERGFPGNSLRKEAVDIAVKDFTNDLTSEAREVLIARKEASSTSYKKLSAIMRQVSPDGRLRNQFIFMGAARSGRWSGNAVQLQNMARPDKQFEEKGALEEARKLIYQEDYEGIKKRFGSVLLTIKSCLRTVFVAPENMKFVVADLSSIETRVVAWLSSCEPLLNVFRENKDAYLDFAVKLTGIPYQKLVEDIKSDDVELKNTAKHHRQMAKPGVLGCCYGLGGGQMGTNKYGDPVRQGLWAYAAAMGVEMSEDQAHEIVRIFRESYQEIPEFWTICEKAVADVLEEGTVRVKREIGPNGCIKLDKLVINQAGDRRNILRIQLPNGRSLHYLNARIESVKVPWVDREGNEVYKDNLVYDGINQETKQWGRVISRGSKVFENLIQAISRDVEARDILESEKIGLPVTAHSHDEIIGLRIDDPFSAGVQELEEIMSQDIDDLPGLRLSAEGFESYFYRKN